MDVSAVKSAAVQSGYSSLCTAQQSSAEVIGKTADLQKTEQGSLVEKAKETEKDKKPIGEEELSALTYEMNKFLEMINSDIQFSLHEKTKRLIVRVVDTRDNRVLKEFPPHEMLDTIAKIREYVGFLLDKKV